MTSWLDKMERAIKLARKGDISYLRRILRDMARVADLTTRREIIQGKRRRAKIIDLAPISFTQARATLPSETVSIVSTIYSDTWASMVAGSAAREAKLQANPNQYALTLYRNTLRNVSSAAMRDEVESNERIQYSHPAYEFMTYGDTNVRGRKPNDQENHYALHRFVAALDDPVWQQWTPPLGHSCRCHLALVPRSQLKHRGLLTAQGRVKKMRFPKNARKHPDFGTP